MAGAEDVRAFAARTGAPPASSRWLTPVIALGMSAVSVVLLLSLTSPELSWDEADLVGTASRSWWSLWSSDPPGQSLRRHYHGPLGLYLAKLGHELPATLGSVEARVRLPTALVASSAIVLLYWLLRRVFQTSRPAAFVGASLLLFSFIRLEETNLIGPHHLIVVCTLALLGLAYRFRDEPGKRGAVVLGVVLGFGALTMTYVIPAAVCVAAALTLAKSRWLSLDGLRPRISVWVLAALGVAGLVLLVLWPPGILALRLVKDFGAFVLMGHHPTLVGERMFEVTPRWAAFYWLFRLDAPIVLVSTAVLALAFWRAWKTRTFSSRHVYLAVCVAFFLATALTAHLAGARNLLLTVAVACLATGALFDEAVGPLLVSRRLAAGLVALVALANLVLLSRSATYTPYLATDGYRAFVTQGARRLAEPAAAVVYGLPVLTFYEREAGVSSAWDAHEIPWTTQSFPLAPDVKYVLIPAFVYEDMPPEHPMRRIVADHWKVVWSFDSPHTWQLRLFERPASAS
jgi:4-amino-4-deoxy-L-arabinose transferase-like glycosyltransferase